MFIEISDVMVCPVVVRFWTAAVFAEATTLRVWTVLVFRMGGRSGTCVRHAFQVRLAHASLTVRAFGVGLQQKTAVESVEVKIVVWIVLTYRMVQLYLTSVRIAIPTSQTTAP
jgi:hypothetical protein